MKVHILSLTALALLAIALLAPSEATAKPSSLPPTPQVDTGGFLIYQTQSNLGLSNGAVSSGDWKMVGFILCETIGGDTEELFVLATQADPTGAKRWSSYTYPGTSSSAAKDIATRYNYIQGTSGQDMDTMWPDLLLKAGLNSSDVTTASFEALSANPLIGSLP